MPTRKPTVIVTRKLPDVVETRMRELFATTLNDTDEPMSQAQLVEAVKKAEVLVPTVTDRIDRPDHAGRSAAQADRQFRQRRRQYRRQTAHGQGITVTNTPVC
jgi:glyoxylate reductase